MRKWTLMEKSIVIFFILLIIFILIGGFTYLQQLIDDVIGWINRH
jgi:hypothetical protein